MYIKIGLYSFLMLFYYGCGEKKQNDRSYTGTDTSTVVKDSLIIDSLTTEVLTQDADTSGLIQKTGTLNYSGNEPFVVPTLFVSDSESYRLTADPVFLQETFEEINGKKVNLFGKEKKVNNITTLEVHFYELIKEEK